MGTPRNANARGKPWPKLTVFNTFSPAGSRSRVTLATQPSVPTMSGSQVCQMSMARKWDRGEFSNPMPWMMAIFPSSYIFLSGPMLGLKAN